MPFQYQPEEQVRIVAAIASVTKARAKELLPKYTKELDHIEGAAGVYIYLVQKRLSPKKAVGRLERLTKSLQTLSSDLDMAEPVLEYAGREAEARGGLAVVLSDARAALGDLETLVVEAAGKVSTHRGRQRKPPLTSDRFDVGTPLEWFITVLADIWKFHRGQWPRLRFRRPRSRR